MSEDTVAGFIFFAFVVFLLFVGALAGYKCGVFDTQSAAVKANVAKWSCDPKTGVSVFEWGSQK